MKQTALVKKGKGGADPFALAAGLADYGVLKARIGEIFVEGRKRVEFELIRMRYHTGLLINEHIRLNNDRAEYGAKAILKLEKDLEVDQSELRRYSIFARAYPIRGGRHELAFNLPWQSYRKLMIVPDDGQRWQMTLEAEKNEWTFEKIESKVAFLIAKEREGDDEPERLPPVSPGPLHTYRVIAVPNLHSGKEELLLDLGFSRRQEMDIFPEARFPADTIVMSVKDAHGYRVRRTEYSESVGAGSVPRTPYEALYTYKAFVERVIDGDTLKLDVRQGFGERFSDTFRLKGIDCPEMDTPEGVAAKRFVQSELAKAEYVTIKSTPSGNKEKYGRYLVDVFYLPARSLKASAGGTCAPQHKCDKGTGPIYLNQLLLDKGYAVRMRS